MESDRPTLIVVDSHIGYGAPHVQDTCLAHGEPLGEDEERAAKRFYGWPEDAQFLDPDGVRQHFAEGVGRRGSQLHAAWRAKFEAYRIRVQTPWQSGGVEGRGMCGPGLLTDSVLWALPGIWGGGVPARDA